MSPSLRDLSWRFPHVPLVDWLQIESHLFELVVHLAFELFYEVDHFAVDMSEFLLCLLLYLLSLLLISLEVQGFFFSWLLCVGLLSNNQLCVADNRALATEVADLALWDIEVEFRAFFRLSRSMHLVPLFFYNLLDLLLVALNASLRQVVPLTDA